MDLSIIKLCIFLSTINVVFGFLGLSYIINPVFEIAGYALSKFGYYLGNTRSHTLFSVAGCWPDSPSRWQVATHLWLTYYLNRQQANKQALSFRLWGASLCRIMPTY